MTILILATSAIAADLLTSGANSAETVVVDLAELRGIGQPARAPSGVQMLNPTDVSAFYGGQLRHAQPICSPGFAGMLPPIETAIDGLRIADTCFYYPEDRDISESVRLGKLMAERVA